MERNWKDGTFKAFDNQGMAVRRANGVKA